MTAAYWVAFALGVIPCLGYLVGLAFLGLGVSRFRNPNGGRWKAWLPIGAAVAAFAIAVWQGVTYDLMFFDWTFGNIQHATILGVGIPFEVGENAAKLTFAMFFGLIVAWTGVGMIFTLFRSRKLRLVQRVVLLATIVAFAWLGWSAFSEALPYWQRLF